MDLQLFRWREPAWLVKGFKSFEELPGAIEAAAELLQVLESECSLCDRTGIDTKLWSQSITCPPQLKERDSAFKGVPHTPRCKQVNPKYLQLWLDPLQELITGFAVWVEVFKSTAEGGRKGGMYLLLLLSWAHRITACGECQPAPVEQLIL